MAGRKPDDQLFGPSTGKPPGTREPPCFAALQLVFWSFYPGLHLPAARLREPGNPVVTANMGLVQASKGDFDGAIRSLSSALAKDPGLHEARFNLAVTYAKAGRRAEAAASARDLLSRLASSAPQRPEVERLLKAVQ